MKKVSLLLSIFCLLLLSGAISAQTGARNFAGSWEINIAKSKLPERTRIEALTMNVSQTSDELTVETVVKRAAPEATAQMDANGGMRPDGNRAARRGGAGGFGGGGIANFPASVTYNLAGNSTVVEPENAAGMPSSVLTLDAKVEKDGKLKLIQTNKITGQNGEFTTTTSDVWELSADGKTLKVSREMTTPRGAQTAEMYFVKLDLTGLSGDAMPSGITGGSVSSANMSEVNGGDAKDASSLARDKSMKGVVVSPKQISGGVLNAKALQMPQPVFPPAARAVKARGAVNVEVTVNEAGNVISANAVSGHPLLRAAAADAARGAKFAPVLVDGIPARVVGILVINFVP